MIRPVHAPSRRFTLASPLSGVLRERIARHARAGRTALVGPAGATSYAALGALIDRCATAFRDVPRGALVGVPATRTAAAVARFFGIMQAGGCPCFLEPGLTADAVLRRAHAVGMRRLVIEPASEAMAGDLERGGLDVRRAADRERRLSAHRAVGGRAGDDGPPGPVDLAMMQFTSGSTGLPKGALLTHGSLLHHAAGIIERTGLTAADRLLHVMPLHHTNGVNNQLIAPLLAGATVVLADRFRPADIEDRIAEHEVTCLTGVPTMYARILPHLQDRTRLRALRLLRCGSAPVTDRLHREVEEAFGVRLIISYGLSEATCTSTMNPPGARRIGTVGTVLPGQQVRIFRPGTDEESPAGDEGEIRIAGPCLMHGYADAGRAGYDAIRAGYDTARDGCDRAQDAPTTSRAPLVRAQTGDDWAVESPIRDGWLRTGDLGRLDADGYLTVTGRLKDVIVRGGENLAPQAIERVLARHPAVAACCVVGAPHAELGEAPVGFIVRRPGATVDAPALAAYVRHHLSRTHVPAIVHFVDALPVNAVGKVDRRALRGRTT